MPVFGTCAGMILLATEVLDGRSDQRTFGLVDLTVRRNGYGRQLDSFETDLQVAGLDTPFHGVFIRAPRVEAVGPAVEVLATHDGDPVLVCQGRMMTASFHPELTPDTRLHERFIKLVRETGGALRCQATPSGRPSSTRRAPSTGPAASCSTSSPGSSRSRLAPAAAIPDVNPTLRTAVQKAKAAQMTNDAIDRAIKRGTGEGDAGTYESIMYEGYAPGGVALLIDVLTDNRNRTGSEVRGVFTRHGGSLAEPGSVSWQFGRRGVIMIDGAATEDDVMLAALDAGADDVADDGGTWRITTDASTVYDVRDALTSAGLAVLSADAPMVSDNVVPITSVEEAKRVLRVVEALEDNDDVQDVFANFDIADDVMDDVMETSS